MSDTLTSTSTSNMTSYLTKFWQFFKKVWLFLANAIGSLVLLLIILAFLGSSLSENATNLPTISKKVIRPGGNEVVAVVNLSGPILESGQTTDPLGFSSTMIAVDRVKELLTALEDDGAVKAVVLRINSPGGAVVASDELYRVVKQLNSVKPVVVSMGDMAASGGYYIAAPSSEIIANPATITGSIGVIAQFPQLSGLYEKLGVEMRTFKSGEFKDIGAVDREMTQAEAEILDSIVTDSYDQFVQAVTTGRNLPEEEVRRLADGRIYSGRQAQANGLIDQLGNLDTAIQSAERLASVDGAEVIEYSNQSFFESLLQSVSIRSPLAQLNQALPSTSFRLYYLLDL